MFTSKLSAEFQRNSDVSLSSGTKSGSASPASYRSAGDEAGRCAVRLARDIHMVGVSHRSVPVIVREKLAPSQGSTRVLLDELRHKLHLRELVILSTCNRVEFYWTADIPVRPTAFFEILGSTPEQSFAKISSSLSSRDGKDAVRHLFSVACGLDSMVLGETQIFHQVKRAYETSREGGCTGPALNSLFQAAFKVAKEVHRSTGLADRRASVPSVALDMAAAIFKDLSKASVLVIGTGEIARLTINALRRRGGDVLGCVSRSAERAASLLVHPGETAWTIAELPRVLHRADIIVTCTSSDKPVITSGDVHFALASRSQQRRPLLVLDLGVPRNVDPAVGRLEGVCLRNIDDLKRVAERNKKLQKREAESARRVVSDALIKYYRKLNASSIIRDYRAMAEWIARRELDKVFKQLTSLSPREREGIEEMVTRMLKRLLQSQMNAIRAAVRNGKSCESVAWSQHQSTVDNVNLICAQLLHERAAKRIS